MGVEFPSQCPLRVLVVEDDVDSAESLRAALEISGYAVEVALGAREGVERAGAFRPEVVLCDLGLPDADGFAVARSLREHPELRGVRLIALSGYAHTDHVQRALAAGFDHHVAKPADIDLLSELICAH